MKNSILFFMLIAFASCSKDAKITPDAIVNPVSSPTSPGTHSITYPDSILAGQKNGKGVLYTDTAVAMQFNPRSDQELFLDLNKDGVNDLCFKFHGEGSPMYNYFLYTLLPLNNTSIATVGSNVDTLIQGTVIDSTRFWFSGTCLLAESRSSSMGSGYSNGLWFGQTDDYIGVKLKTGTHILYGWVRFTFASGLTVEEYAHTAPY